MPKRPVLDRLPVIYVAGPYSGRGWPWPLNVIVQARNTLRAALVSVALMLRGWAVICPHTMTCLFPLLSRYRLKWSDFMKMDLEILSRCDALYYIAPSVGADMELEVAKDLGIEVYYSLDEVPHARAFRG